MTVHTGHPHYPSGQIAAGHRNRILRREEDNGVRVLRSLVYPAENRGFARRVLDHTALAASAIATCPASGEVDLVIAESPPLFTAAAGVLYSALKRAALILNISDLWPESAIELGALSSPPAIAASDGLARYCYRHAAAITTPTQTIVRRLTEIPQAAGKVHHVPPAVDLDRFSGLDRISPSSERPLRVLYAGTIGIAQSLHTLIEAAAIAGPRVLDLRIAGEGPELPRLKRMVHERGLGNVRLLGPVAAEGVPALYGEVDAGVVCLRDLALFQGALPSKLFEVLAAGRAVILSARGEAAEVIERHGAGVAVAPENPRALAEAFMSLSSDPVLTMEVASRARAAAALYSREAAVERWWSIISEIAGRRS